MVQNAETSSSKKIIATHSVHVGSLEKIRKDSQRMAHLIIKLLQNSISKMGNYGFTKKHCTFKSIALCNNFILLAQNA